jgi:hypothetical protein
VLAKKRGQAGSGLALRVFLTTNPKQSGGPVTRISQSRTARLFSIACLILTLLFSSLAVPVGAEDTPANPPIMEPPLPFDPGPLGLVVIDPFTVLAITEAISVI